MNGKAVGYFWTNVVGGHSRVFPGDHMSLSMNYGRGSLELVVSDDTQGWGQGVDLDGSGGPRMTRATFVVQAGSGDSSLTKFGRVAFDGCRLDYQKLGAQNPQRLVMKTSEGAVRAAPSAITADGDFSVAWKHS